MGNNHDKAILVACAIIQKDGKVFIARRKPDKSQGGKWEFPGGKVENGESIKECLVREFEEEFGVILEVGERCGSNTHDYESISIELIGHYCKMNTNNFSLTDHDLTAWVSIEELRSYDLAPADIPLIELIH